MKLDEVFARKTYGDPNNESEQLAKDYIKYARDGYLSGADFDIRGEVIVIYQETDESEDDGEGADKYIVSKSDIRPQLWKALLKVAQAHGG